MEDSVKNIIDNILKNPGDISNIIDSIKNDSSTLNKVMTYVNNNPELKSKLTNSVMNDDESRNKINKMSRKEKAKITKKGKKIQHSLDHVGDSMKITVAKISLSRKIKLVKIMPFTDIDLHYDRIKLTESILLLSPKTKCRINREGRKYTEQVVYDEPLFVKFDEKGSILPITLEEVKLLEKQK